MSDSARNRANGFETMGPGSGPRGNSSGQNPQSYKFNGGSLRFLGVIGIVILLLILAFNCAYKIGEQEQGVLVTFGKAQAVTDPGLHFKIPFAQSIYKVNTTIQGFSIGYDMNSNAANESESLMITSDYNFVNVDFFVEYRYSDPVKALYASKDPTSILKNVSKSCIRSVISGYPVDSVLTTGKGEIQASIKERIIADLEKQEL